jgi:predicted nucleic acid-binding protein
MVIVDSSTLIHLSAIGRFALLQDLPGSLTVTPAVWWEVVEQGKDRTGVADLEAAGEKPQP